MPTTSTKDPPDQLPSITTLSNFNVHYHNIINDTQLLESINSCRSTSHHHHSRLLYILTDPSFIQRYNNVFSIAPTAAAGSLLHSSIAPIAPSMATVENNGNSGYKTISQQPSLSKTDVSNMLPVAAVKSSDSNMASVSLIDIRQQQQQQQQQHLFNSYYHSASLSPASFTDSNINMNFGRHYNNSNSNSNNTQTYDRLANTTLIPCVPPQPLLPPPQPSIAKQSIAVAAVDDCCDACCPAIAHTVDDTHRIQPSTQPTATLVPCTLNHDEEPTEESVVLPSIKGRKRSSSSVSTDTSLSKKVKWDDTFKSNNDNNNAQRNVPISQQVQKAATDYSHISNSSTTRCQWSSCVASFDSLEDLPDHLFQEHLNNLLNGRDITVDGAATSKVSDTETSAPTPTTTITHDVNSSASSSNTSSPLTAAEEEYLLNCYWASCTEKFNITESFIDHLYKQHLHFIQQQQQKQQHQIQAPSIPLVSPADCPGYKCQWLHCQHTFNEMESLVHHVSTVHVTAGGGQQKNEYCCQWASCERAGKPFTQRQKLLRHLQTMHLKFKPFQCDICQKSFSEARLMLQHKRTHTGEKPFACDQCDKKFSVASALTIHKRTLHSGEKPFVCKYCDKKFPESSNLTKHMRIHTGEKPFKCALCDAAFARPDQRARHKKSHNNSSDNKERKK